MASNRNSTDDTQRLWRLSLHNQGLPNEWHARAQADHEQRQQEEAAATRDPVTRSNTPAREECSLTRPDCLTKTCVHWKKRKPLRNSWLATPPDISEFSPEYQQKHREMQGKREHDAAILAATRRSLGYGYDTAEQDDFMEHFKADEGKLPLESAPADTSSRRVSSADNADRRSRYSTFFLNDSLSDIPQRYFDEADRMWHEWEEDNDADQYMADIMHKAPWREVHREEPASDFGILPSTPRLRYKYTESEHEPSRREEEVVSPAPRFPYNEREYEPPRHEEEIASNAPRSEEEMGSRWSESTSALGEEGEGNPAVRPPRKKLTKKDKKKKGDDTDVPQRRLSMKKFKDGLKRLSGIH